MNEQELSGAALQIIDEAHKMYQEAVETDPHHQYKDTAVCLGRVSGTQWMHNVLSRASREVLAEYDERIGYDTDHPTDPWHPVPVGLIEFRNELEEAFQRLGLTLEEESL